MYILSVTHPLLTGECQSSLLDTQNQLSDYLIPGNRLDRMRLRMNKADTISNYPVVISFWNYSSEYSETPLGRILMVNFEYGGSGLTGKMESIMSSEKYRQSIARNILSSCKSIGIVKFAPSRTTGVHHFHVVSFDQATTIMPALVDPQCSEPLRSPAKLRWGEVWSEC
jgi:hypothetical protein